ncbi:hypothetical protein FQ017_00905, partial [Flagellimonas pelagia]
MLTLSNPATGGNSVDLSGYTETVAGANDITVTDDGNGNYTVDYVDGDKSSTNELQNAIEVPFDASTTTLTSGNVQNVIEELKAEVDAFAATSGQTNTASNAGVGGVGTFARKTGADLEFKNVNAGSNKITVSDDIANDEIDIDINEANLIITESQISDLNHTVNTDSQDLSLSGDDLSLSGDPTATPIDLSGYTETVAGANDITVTDDGNGNYTVDYVDGDKSSTNELSDLSLDGSNVLTLSNPATGGNSVDLSG